MSTGLFLVRRLSTWMTRRISSSRPMTGSSLPSRARSVRSGRTGQLADGALRGGVEGRGIGADALQQRADGVVGHHQQPVQQVAGLGLGVAVGERIAQRCADGVPALGRQFLGIHSGPFRGGGEVEFNRLNLTDEPSIPEDG
jgi:hypothetical protein